MEQSSTHTQSFLFIFCLSIAVLFTSCSTNLAQPTDDTTDAISRGPEKGSLLIIGGGRLDAVFYQVFMEKAGGKNAPIVVIPTASGDESFEDDSLFFSITRRFQEQGFTDVTVLHTRDPREADTETFIQPINRAGGVWFLGGRQWRLADSYLDTRTHSALINLLQRGGIIAGSSAGATIQGSYLARGDTQANTIMMGDHEEGLGFVTNIAIDQHLLVRNRQFDMFEILDHRPELLGIGLDENTGILVEGNTFEVLGNSFVAVYDGTRWSAERDTVYQLPEGNREYYFLRKGHRYDLTERKVIR